MNKVSFIGLGNMGMPMALNLIKKKYKLNLYDIDKKLYKYFVKTDATPISELNQLTDNSNVFITMLPDGKALNRLVLGKEGIINTIKKNSIFIDCSSSDYNSTIKVSRALYKKKVNFLDAPVSGGVYGAQNASLTIMVGGSKSVFDKSKKILNCIGKSVVYIGESGTGQIVKACNNMMLGINMLGLCEAFLLAKKFGINPKKLFEICSNSSGSSWAMLNHLPIKGIVKNTAANNNFIPGYAARLILKDLKISQEMAKSVKFNTKMSKKALELYKKFCKIDKKNLDYTAIIKLLNK